MSKKTLQSRLSIVERELVTAKGVIKELYLEGGFYGPGVAIRAKIIGGLSFEGEPGEQFEAFQTRIRAVAEAEGAEMFTAACLPLRLNGPNRPAWRRH